MILNEVKAIKLMEQLKGNIKVIGQNMVCECDPLTRPGGIVVHEYTTDIDLCKNLAQVKVNVEDYRAASDTMWLCNECIAHG